jgi:hypothetical protein
VKRECLSDHLRTIVRQQERKGAEVDLRGRVWLQHVQHQNQLTPTQIGRALYGERSVSNLVAKWLLGSVSPTRHSALAIERKYPGSLWVFDLPLWPLLKDAPISSLTVQRLKRPYLDNSGILPMWKFPVDDDDIWRRRVPPAFAFDTGGLVARNDLWGLVGVVMQVRLYEATGATERYLDACQDMVRALPGALRLPWIRPFADQMIDCVDRIRFRDFYATLFFDIDREIILRQADDCAYEPCRELRTRDPDTGSFIEIEDPVLPATFIPGVVARKMKQGAS